MAAIPTCILAAAFLPGEHADLIGPIRPAAYASAYFMLALPYAFVTMALMFSAATFGRRGVVSYLGGAFVFFAAVVSWPATRPAALSRARRSPAETRFAPITYAMRRAFPCSGCWSTGTGPVADSTDHAPRG